MPDAKVFESWTRSTAELNNRNNRLVLIPYLGSNCLIQSVWTICPLEWVSRGNAEEYLAKHRYENTNSELRASFISAIDWVTGVFDFAPEEEKGISNCPYCALSHDANRIRIWKLVEMDADHITAWSKGGCTDIGNCQMFCKTYNRAWRNR